VIRPASWLLVASRRSLVLIGACTVLATTATVVGAGYVYAVGVGLATVRGREAS
jgi:hypothetical protein